MLSKHQTKVAVTMRRLRNALAYRFDVPDEIQRLILEQPLSDYFLYLEKVHIDAKELIPKVQPPGLGITRQDSTSTRRYRQNLAKACVEILAATFLMFRKFRPDELSLVDAVAQFGQKMDAVLQQNSYKRGWGDLPVSWFWLRMEDELAELRAVVIQFESGEPIGWEPVVKEAIDVANFSLMVLDVLELLE